MDLADLDLDLPTLLLLWAARETGALDALARDADTAREVAAAADIDDLAATVLVESLHAEGFLEPVGGAYEPTNRMLGFLAAADLRSVGRLPDALDAVDALLGLPAAMASGDPSSEGSVHHRLGARAATDDATVRAVTTAALRAAPDPGHVLDVRGAPGQYARAFEALGHAVTLADRADAVERSTPLLATTDVDAVPVAAGDPLPPADLVFAGDVTRRLAPDDARAFVARLAAAADPGGTVVVTDLLWDRSERAVPAAVTAFARDGGTVHDAASMTDWFADAGLVDPRVVAIPGTDRDAVVGTGPS